MKKYRFKLSVRINFSNNYVSIANRSAGPRLRCNMNISVDREHQNWTTRERYWCWSKNVYELCIWYPKSHIQCSICTCYWFVLVSAKRLSNGWYRRHCSMLEDIICSRSSYLGLISIYVELIWHFCPGSMDNNQCACELAEVDCNWCHACWRSLYTVQCRGSNRNGVISATGKKTIFRWMWR